MSHITEFHAHRVVPARQNPIPEGFDMSTATWAQLEAIMFDKPFPL